VKREAFASSQLVSQPVSRAKMLGRRWGLTANLHGECLGKLDRPLMTPAASSAHGPAHKGSRTTGEGPANGIGVPFIPSVNVLTVP